MAARRPWRHMVSKWIGLDRRKSERRDMAERIRRRAAVRRISPSSRASSSACRFGDYLFVHAGLRPGVPLAAQGEADLIWIRSPVPRSCRAVRQDRGAWPHARGTSRSRGRTESASIPEPVFTGRLTALRLEGSSTGASCKHELGSGSGLGRLGDEAAEAIAQASAAARRLARAAPLSARGEALRDRGLAAPRLRSRRRRELHLDRRHHALRPRCHLVLHGNGLDVCVSGSAIATAPGRDRRRFLPLFVA